MTITTAKPVAEVVASIMSELRELSGGETAVSGEVLRTAITSVMALDFRVVEQDFPPGLRAMTRDCSARPGSVQELKYVERELYGALTQPS